MNIVVITYNLFVLANKECKKNFIRPWKLSTCVIMPLFESERGEVKYFLNQVKSISQFSTKSKKNVQKYINEVSFVIKLPASYANDVNW